MSLDKHDLHHEFPEYNDAIHALKVSDPHFAALFAQYHDLDHEVRRIETGVRERQRRLAVEIMHDALGQPFIRRQFIGIHAQADDSGQFQPGVAMGIHR